MKEFVEDIYSLDTIRIDGEFIREQAQKIINEANLSRAFIPYLRSRVASITNALTAIQCKLEESEAEK